MKKTAQKPTAILLIHCPDTQGIVAKVTEFLDNNDGNIINLDQHVDHDNNVFFMRIEWELTNFRIPKEKIGDFFGTQIASRYDMQWRLYFPERKARMALFVSKANHCLFDILSRFQSGSFEVDIPCVISNHETLRATVERFGIPFFHIPITKDTKAAQEKKELAILKEHQVDFIVLARYMQILSPAFVEAFPNKIINIHHSFLPAFPGAKPYHSAYQRGVKIIGATSHYVTSELDAGPIIEQDVIRVSHHDSIADLVRKGQDLEKVVLSKAVYLHLQRKLLAYNNKTIVFT